MHCEFAILNAYVESAFSQAILLVLSATGTSVTSYKLDLSILVLFIIVIFWGIGWGLSAMLLVSTSPLLTPLETAL